MKRRGVLGLLGGALAAGPSMAKEAVAGLESLAVPKGIATQALAGIRPAADWAMDTESEIGWGDEQDYGEWLRDRLKELAGLTDQDKQERLARMQVYELDADLQANRSFSLSAKIHLQKRRDLERELANEKRSLSRQLAEWLKREELI